MSEGVFFSNSYQGAKALLDAAAARHEALASNLANAETPGYRRVDISSDFVNEMRRAVESGDPAAVRNLRPAITADPSRGMEKPNGNNVAVDRELLEINRNALEYDAYVELVSGSLKQLKVAITGRSF